MVSHEKTKGRRHNPHRSTQRIEHTIPWVTSPMEDWDKEEESFSPRHEASTLELFFDLFFVANLATFTQYHAITNRYNFWSYVAFFIVLWMTWFHIVCFDARFSVDSVWERSCKVVHFSTFTGFALVGYKFNLFVEPTPHWIFRILCWALFLSRFWLALQYLVTAMFCSSPKNRHLQLSLPLVVNTGVFFLASIVYGGLSTGFSNEKSDVTGVIVGVYIVMLFELVGTLSISCIWSKLSFRATHIAERLGLLGLIIIGEGVIGTTKTITRIMGKNGVYLEGCALIFCIILILVFMWMVYFDNLPKYRFSTIKQQFWMILHLPLHLSILGVVEGCQHIALARYTYFNGKKLAISVWHACVQDHLDGEKLASNLTRQIEYFKLDDSAQGDISLPYIFDQIYFLGNQTGVCDPSNTTDVSNGMEGIPLIFTEFFERAFGGMFQAFDMDIPIEGEVYGIEIAAESWKVVYTYFWSALLLLYFCLTVAALLADKGMQISRFRFASMLARTAMVTSCVVILSKGLNHPSFFNDYLGSVWILPTVVIQLWIVCLGDRISRWRIGRRDEKYARVGPIYSAEEESRRHEVMGGRRR